MANDFAAGESDSGRGAPPITQEVMGAQLAITATRPGPNAGVQTSEPYLMPSVVGRNGGMERVEASITHTPLGGMVPGPNAIAPATADVTDYRMPIPDEAGPFASGLKDGFPEGLPIPYRV